MPWNIFKLSIFKHYRLAVKKIDPLRAGGGEGGEEGWVLKRGLKIAQGARQLQLLEPEPFACTSARSISALQLDIRSSLSGTDAKERRQGQSPSRLEVTLGTPPAERYHAEGHLAILGLKKHFQHIFIFGNEKNRPVGIVMQIVGHRLDKAPWLVRMAEHTLTENNDFHALLQRACDNSMNWLFLPVLSYKCQY